MPGLRPSFESAPVLFFPENVCDFSDLERIFKKSPGIDQFVLAFIREVARLDKCFPTKMKKWRFHLYFCPYRSVSVSSVRMSEGDAT